MKMPKLYRMSKIPTFLKFQEQNNHCFNCSLFFILNTENMKIVVSILLLSQSQEMLLHQKNEDMILHYYFENTMIKKDKNK